VLLLVQEKTLIGRPDASHQQDIQLLGLGIMPEHCVIVIDGSDVVLIPLDGARWAGYLIIMLWLLSNFTCFCYILYLIDMPVAMVVTMIH